MDGQSDFCLKWMGCNYKRRSLRITCCSLICLMVVVVIPVLIGTSITKVDDGERAVMYSTITQEIVGVRGPGLHFMKPGMAGELYSRRVVVHSVDDAMCTTREGIQATMEVEAQFTYDNDESNLVELFRTIGPASNVVTLVDSITRNTILEVCGNLSAVDMYVNRAQAELATNAMVRGAINNDPVAVTGDNGPVRTITLPSSLQEQLKGKDTAWERVEVSMRERSPIIIDANTDLEAAEFRQTSLLQDARSEADRILFKARKDEETVMREMQLLGEQFALSAEELGVTADELLHDVLETSQRGEEQSRSLQLCLADCRRPGSAFSCGLCYLSDAGQAGSLIMNLPSPEQAAPADPANP